MIHFLMGIIEMLVISMHIYFTVDSTINESRFNILEKANLILYEDQRYMVGFFPTLSSIRQA